MAWTAPKIAQEERRDSLETIELGAAKLVDAIRNSKHFIAFTGAGISTSAGVPDFRGPDGHWTLMAQGRTRQGQTTDTLQAVPTTAHMALVALQDRGILKYVVSQNCDGLHRRSGILPGQLSELHGNNNREQCKDCGKEYIRDFRTSAPKDRPTTYHRTGRRCAVCGGHLYDTIINFGEDLPQQALDLAYKHAKKADLCLVLGSSLTVTPASKIPDVVGRKTNATLAMCNLQDTPLDKLAKLRFFTDADNLMEKVMQELNIPIPSFILRRRLLIEVTSRDAERHELTVVGVDSDNTPASFLRSVRLLHNRRVVREEPFTVNIRGDLPAGTQLKVVLEFMGNYNEPALEIVHERGLEQGKKLYLLAYDPLKGSWSTEVQNNINTT